MRRRGAAGSYDGDTIAVGGVSATSTNGGAVSLAGGMVTYTPASGFVGADRFSYTVSDGRGGSAAAPLNPFVSIKRRSASPPGNSSIESPK